MKEEEKWDIPLFSINPGPVVVFMNMMAPSDLYDQEEVERVQSDLIEQCETFGKVEKVHVPRPVLLTETQYRTIEVTNRVDRIESMHALSPAVGKIFVKFETVAAAKIARFRLSGRQYNKRTVVASFYPEHYFDIGEFAII